jgi:hypothetical protein
VLIPLVAPAPVFSEPPPAVTTSFAPAAPGAKERVLELARRYPVVWMALAPAAAAIAVIGIAALTAPTPKPRPVVAAVAAPVEAAPSPAEAAAPTVAEKAAVPNVADLEGKPLDTLGAGELLRLAEARAARRREAGQALCSKLESTPTLISDKATQSELFKLIGDAETSRTGLATLAKVDSPVAADLLYEVWTGTTAKTEATELAHQIVLSKDVRSKASPALAVALDLRSAASCEDTKAVLPRALKDGDRRSLHLLTKLLAKRGCGAKKNEDCYACLRADAGDLTTTINAVKGRRAPAYPSP